MCSADTQVDYHLMAGRHHPEFEASSNHRRVDEKMDMFLDNVCE